MVAGLDDVMVFDGEAHPRRFVTDTIDGGIDDPDCGVFAQKQPLGIGKWAPPAYTIQTVLRKYGHHFVIAAVRDPRDALTSLHPTWPEEYWYPHEDCTLQDLLATYKDALRDIIASRCIDACHIVRYEDLVTHPEDEMRKAAAFLGVEYSDESLHIERLGAKRALAVPMRGVRPLSTKSIGRWKHERHAQRIADVWDDELQRLAAQFGYYEEKGVVSATG
jgi:hypothetical protein